MATILCDDLDLCQDCAMLVANDDATDEHRAAFAAQAHEGQIVLSCSDCGEDGCDGFSTVRCDGCGSDLAGTRHKAVMFG